MGEPVGTPRPNRADAAWEELQALRAEAVRLGVEVDPSDPLVVMREKVEAARKARPDA